MVIKNANRAFTLAEVLITLGIIGVIAALTIPTLIANTRSTKFRSQFKKTISSLNQAVFMNKANYGFDFSDLEEKQCGQDHAYDFSLDNPKDDKTFCAILNGNLQSTQYMMGTIEQRVSYMDENVKFSALDQLAAPDEMSMYMFLPDGTMIAANPAFGVDGCYLNSNNKINDDYLCTAYIDVNGYAGPNKEVSCSNNTETILFEKTPCTVKNSDVTDIYPIIIHDSTVEPASNAARYILSTVK